VERVIALIEPLSEKKSSCCFAIDGAWGSGKSFVLNMIREQLGKYCSETVAGDKYLILPYNCWEYDYYEEPAVAIVAAMKDSIEEQTSEAGAVVKEGLNAAKKIILNVAGKVAKNITGIDPINIAQELHDGVEKRRANENQFDTMFSFKKTLDETRNSLKELAKDQTVLFIVDELDRCLPAYAIKVLERLHHLFFGIENIIVMIAVDSSQLENSVKQLYGEKVNVDRYLRKFIDFTMTLDNGKVSGKFEDKYREYFSYFSPLYETMDDAIKSFNEFYNEFCSEMDMRTQEKLINRAYTVHRLICGEEKYDLALLLFEILSVTVAYYSKLKNLELFFRITKIDFVEHENMAAFIDVVYDRFKKMAPGKMYYVENEFLIDGVIVILVNLYGKSIDDSMEVSLWDEEQYRKEIEMAKRFEELIKLM